MTPEERVQKAMDENIAGGWGSYPNTYAALVAAVRAAEDEARASAVCPKCSGPPCGGCRCHQAEDGKWIHSSKSYDSCAALRDEESAP